MKSIIYPWGFFFLLIFLSQSLFAQQLPDFANQRRIEVTGSAEMEVIPDEIYVSILLKEYMDGKEKVSLNSLEKELFDGLKAANIDTEQLSVDRTIASMQGKKRRKQELLASKRYVLKLTTMPQTQEVFDQLADSRIEKVSVDRLSHSEITTFRRELKIRAMQAAKEKAEYLLEAVGEKVGHLLYVEELGSYIPMNRVNAASNYAANYMNENIYLIDRANSDAQGTDARKLKLNYEIKSIFAISEN